MKRVLPLLLLCSAFLAGADFEPDAVKLTGKTDKSALSYEPGEAMVYTVKAELAGQSPDGLQIRWIRSGDDGKTESGSVPTNQEAVVKTSLEKPGFVRVNFLLTDDQGKTIRQHAGKNKKKMQDIGFYAGTAVSPEKLKDCGEPDDFDAFWTKQKEKLSKVPFQDNVGLTEVKKMKGCTIYAVSIPCAGPRPATGFLSVPDDALPKSLPIHIQFAGYGARQSNPPGNVSTKRIELAVNAHGQKLMQSKEYYEEFFKSIRSGKYDYAFDPEQNKDPETAFFNGMALRALRALEYMKTRPEWDGKNIVVKGGSQGGLQSVWLTALDPAVTEAQVAIIWCCDIAGRAKANRLIGDWCIPYVAGLDYYDPVFMAKRIKTAKVKIMRAGLGDYTSPPSGLAIFYNNLATKKKSISWVQGSSHGFVPEDSEIIVWKK